jgi:hypothetical protein
MSNLIHYPNLTQQKFSRFAFFIRRFTSLLCNHSAKCSASPLWAYRDRHRHTARVYESSTTSNDDRISDSGCSDPKLFTLASRRRLYDTLPPFAGRIVTIWLRDRVVGARTPNGPARIVSNDPHSRTARHSIGCPHQVRFTCTTITLTPARHIYCRPGARDHWVLWNGGSPRAWSSYLAPCSVIYK